MSKQPKADFDWKIKDGTLLIVDRNLGNISVTNDIDNVLEIIAKVLTNIDKQIHPSLVDIEILYRDSSGVWDLVIVEPHPVLANQVQIEISAGPRDGSPEKAWAAS